MCIRDSVEIANKIASTAALFRKYFPDASVNFSPWDNLNNESMQDTIDFAFHFPGWSPLIECRAILLQLRIENHSNRRVPKLLLISKLKQIMSFSKKYSATYECEFKCK